MDGYREGHFRVLIATSLADEGFDAPIAQTLVLASGGRSPAKLEQRVGRVLRPHPGKDGGHVVDFDGACFGMTMAQAKKRLAIYRKLGYNVPTLKQQPAPRPDLDEYRRVMGQRGL
jgi:superfamily II DNA or RNA helicase